MEKLKMYEKNKNKIYNKIYNKIHNKNKKKKFTKKKLSLLIKKYVFYQINHNIKYFLEMKQEMNKI